jgi:hypothetical protein
MKGSLELFGDMLNVGGVMIIYVEVFLIVGEWVVVSGIGIILLFFFEN